MCVNVCKICNSNQNKKLLFKQLLLALLVVQRIQTRGIKLWP